MKQTIQLYTTAGCHLCEDAQAMLQYLIKNDPRFNSIKLNLVEIANDDQLVETYGVRIPVLTNKQQELGWPFELEQLENWLVHLQANH